MEKNVNQARIGIDLDNTIICYDKAFQEGAISKCLVDERCKLSKKQEPKTEQVDNKE